ncbi:MAG: fumarylacetoacetase [Phycisphaerales bacterium]|nr:fumarylacetoacetase [Phycisphaerales bacterium]
MAINETHDPNLKSWVESANDPTTDFPIQNLPFVAFRRPDEQEAWVHSRLGIRIGDRVIDIWALAERGLLDEGAFAHDLSTFETGPLGSALTRDTGARELHELRRQVRNLLHADTQRLHRDGSARERAVLAADSLAWCTPFDPPDYTDFYASIHHATTVGSMFRPDNALLPNYKWVPIGYHGRASSIVVGGTDIRRPIGQQAPPDDRPTQPPTVGPSKMLDYELEVGAFIGPGNDLGKPIPIGDAEKHIFGLCLVNDWSARDLQKWEYQPLGPFLAKNFATTISPYVVTLEALEPFRCPAFRRPDSDPRPLPYLLDEQNQARGGIDLTLEVWLRSAEMERRGMSAVRISRSNAFKDLYWTLGQLVAHHASNGCNLRPGDLIASGTVSGPEPGTRGCMLESTWQGRGPDGKPLPRKPIELPTGEKRTFLEDGDEVTLRGYCERDGFRRVGFGECRGKVLPARA